jgi:hypothetical protein
VAGKKKNQTLEQSVEKTETQVNTQTEAQTEAQEAQEAPARKTRLTVDRDTLVEVMNSTNGQFVHISRKTGQAWEFDKYGATDWMDVGELLSIRSAHSIVLTEPMLLVLDDTVVEYLGLTSLYENVLDESDVKRFFSLPVDQMEETLKKVPDGIKRLLTQKAVAMVDSGELDSVSKRKLFERLFKIELVD